MALVCQENATCRNVINKGNNVCIVRNVVSVFLDFIAMATQGGGGERTLSTICLTVFLWRIDICMNFIISELSN